MHLWQQRQEKYWMSINPSVISAEGWRRKKSIYICTEMCIRVFFEKILFLTVSKNKIATTPENIGVVAILTVVLNYSILFPSFTFFLDGFHLAFGDKFEICIKTTDLM